ncbi:hypothetical protein [Amycolatopsis alba]|uniref:hypothetical protein n=1 Tax=Amycolatopsis alba TaxID=76020 RepID=UPI000362B497|nr:hypothetical protein [Amycolatopsis alba]
MTTAGVVAVPPTARAAETRIYDEPGRYTFTVPDGVTALTVRVWGGGGAGGNGGGDYDEGIAVHSERASGGGGGGGGGGSYLECALTGVNPGQRYIVTVGAPGSRELTDDIKRIISLLQSGEINDAVGELISILPSAFPVVRRALNLALSGDIDGVLALLVAFVVDGGNVTGGGSAMVGAGDPATAVRAPGGNPAANGGQALRKTGGSGGTGATGANAPTCTGAHDVTATVVNTVSGGNGSTGGKGTTGSRGNGGAGGTGGTGFGGVGGGGGGGGGAGTNDGFGGKGGAGTDQGEDGDTAIRINMGRGGTGSPGRVALTW